MHLKRQQAPKSWPVERKGTAYLVKPSFNTKNGVPILIILRDLLKVAKNRKEVKKAIGLKQILINNKSVKDEKNPVLLFDVVTIIQAENENSTKKQTYKIVLSKKGKINVDKIKENDVVKKISKVISKKILKGRKVQLNLSDGRNFISEIKCNINDSVLINFKEKPEIEKCLPLKEKKKILVFAGKHAGNEGIIDKLHSQNKMAEVIIDGKKISVLIKQIIVLD